jgi:hypothetical protein
MILFILCVLVTYRLSRLISIDTGPYDMCMLFREFLGKKAAEYGMVGNRTWRMLAELTNCPYCNGAWIALVLSFIFKFDYPWWLIWLAIAGAQSFLVSVSGDTDGL